MGKVLSQEEIDALLNDAKKGKDLSKLGKGKKTVEYIYDWKNPQKLNPEAKRQLKQIFGIFATSFQTYLQATLKSLVDVNLTDMSTVSYSDYLLSIAEPTCMYKIILDKLKGEAAIEFQPNFTFFLIDKLLGGYGNIYDITRATTDIENSLMLKVLHNFLNSLKEAWRNHINNLNFQYNGFENNPNFVNIAPPTDLVAIFSFEITIKKHIFSFSICFPSRVLDPILDKISKSSWKVKENVTKKNINLIEDYIKFSQVEVKVVLKEFELKFEDFKNLEEGDVINLDLPKDTDLLMTIDNKPKYFVKLGIKGGKKAFEFIRQLTPEEERKYASR